MKFEKYDFNNAINEANLLSFDDNADTIEFSQSDNTINSAMKRQLPNILKQTDKNNFEQQLRSYVFKDKSMLGFKFINNEVFNQNPVYIKFAKSYYTPFPAIEKNLKLNKWKELFTSSSDIENYMYYRYNYNCSDEEIIDHIADSNNNMWAIKNPKQIDIAKRNENYTIIDNLYNVLFNDYFSNFTSFQDAKMQNIGLRPVDMYISPDNVFFCAAICNYRGQRDVDTALGNYAEDDFIIFGYTGQNMPKTNQSLSIDLKQANAFKKELQILLADKDYDTDEIKKINKLPNVFHPEVVNGTLAFVYNHERDITDNGYGQYKWNEIFGKYFTLPNKKDETFIKYKLDFMTWYIDDVELRDKFEDEDESKPVLIKAQWDPKFIILVYNKYHHDRRYTKIVILDNRDYHLGDDHYCITHSKSDRQWYGWRY